MQQEMNIDTPFTPPRNNYFSKGLLNQKQKRFKIAKNEETTKSTIFSSSVAAINTMLKKREIKAKRILFVDCHDTVHVFSNKKTSVNQKVNILAHLMEKNYPMLESDYENLLFSYKAGNSLIFNLITGFSWNLNFNEWNNYLELVSCLNKLRPETKSNLAHEESIEIIGCNPEHAFLIRLIWMNPIFLLSVSKHMYQQYKSKLSIVSHKNTKATSAVQFENLSLDSLAFLGMQFRELENIPLTCDLDKLDAALVEKNAMGSIKPLVEYFNNPKTRRDLQWYRTLLIERESFLADCEDSQTRSHMNNIKEFYANNEFCKSVEMKQASVEQEESLDSLYGE